MLKTLINYSCTAGSNRAIYRKFFYADDFEEFLKGANSAKTYFYSQIVLSAILGSKKSRPPRKTRTIHKKRYVMKLGMILQHVGHRYIGYTGRPRSVIIKRCTVLFPFPRIFCYLPMGSFQKEGSFY